MKKRLVSVVLTGILTASLLTGCQGSGKTDSSGTGQSADESQSGEASSAGDAEKLTFQLGHINPASEYSQCQYLCVEFADKLLELSDGSIAVEVIADGQLGGERDMIEGMQMGTIDMMSIAGFSFDSFVPSMQLLDLPYLFDNSEEAFLVLDDEELLQPVLDEIYEKCSTKVLGFGAGGFRDTLSNKNPIVDVGSLSGQKLRLPETPIYVDTFKALGSNPTTMAFSETFTAMEQGTVDGLEIPIMSIYPSKYHEISDYLSLTEHIYTTFALCVSRDIWESMTEEQQAWLQEAADYAVDAERQFVADTEAELLEEMKAAGCTVNEVENKEEFRQAVQPVYEQYRDEIGGDLIDAALEKLGR